MINLSTRRGTPSLLLLPPSKRSFLQVVVVIVHQSCRRQQDRWRPEDICHHRPCSTRLMIGNKVGESAEVVEVPWRRGFHVKSIDLTLSNPLNPSEDEACCPSWQRKTRKNIGENVGEVLQNHDGSANARSLKSVGIIGNGLKQLRYVLLFS